MSERIRLLTFNDPYALRINKELAQEIGFNESIVILQLEYLITLSPKERDGKLWTYQSLKELQECQFPWWSTMTISRTLKSLEDKELIVSENYNRQGYDRTQWYALNPTGINKLSSIKIYHFEKSIYQNDKSISQIETTIPETSTETTTKKELKYEPDATASAEKKRTKKSQADPRSEAEAIKAIYTITGYRPPLVLYDEIIELLGVTFDKGQLSKCRVAWLKAGYNPKSWDWLFTWYVNGIPERNGNGSHQQQPRTRTQYGKPEVTRDYSKFDG